jgi:hypothetical protein
MGPMAFLPLRRKGCWGFFRPKNPTASAGCEPANLGTKGQHATSRPLKPLHGIHRHNILKTRMNHPLLSAVHPRVSWKCLLTEVISSTTHPPPSLFGISESFNQPQQPPHTQVRTLSRILTNRLYFSLHATSWARTTLIWRHSINSTSTSAMYFKKHAMIFDNRRVNQLHLSPANGRSYLKYVTPQNRRQVPLMGPVPPVHKQCHRITLAMSYPACLFRL